MTDDDAGEAGAAGRDDEIGDLTLADVLIAASEGLAGVTRSAAPDGTRWSVRGSAFAFLAPAGDTAEFRLDRPIASAALRTPGTSPSDLGREWVRFTPDALDDGAVDRAEAWFHSAHRRAGRPGR